MLTQFEVKCLASLIESYEKLSEFDRGRLVGIGEAMNGTVTAKEAENNGNGD